MAFGSLRSEYHRARGNSSSVRRLPRPGDERGIVGDLAPPMGTALAPRRARVRRFSRPAPIRRGPPGARTLLTLSVIFSWFGL
jgi:hypothetical protein